MEGQLLVVLLALELDLLLRDLQEQRLGQWLVRLYKKYFKPLAKKSKRDAFREMKIEKLAQFLKKQKSGLKKILKQESNYVQTIF